MNGKEELLGLELLLLMEKISFIGEKLLFSMKYSMFLCIRLLFFLVRI